MVYVIEEMANPVLISEDDIHINVDKFESGESNILQITGLSGSGKSTLAKELAKKYNAYLVETDIICFAISRPDRANWEYIKEHDKYLYKYMKEKNISPEFMMKYHYTTITRTTADERDTEGLKYLRWLYFEADIKERVIVEGGCVAFSIMKDDKFLKIPTIFKGTSIAYSMLRRLHRSAIDEKKGYIKALQIAAEYYYKQYSKMVPEVNAAREKALNYKNNPTIPYISSEEDIYINMNKFESTKKILILGLSGSGKSTLADKLAKKYKAEHVNLDRIRGNKYYDDSTFNKENPSIAEWFRKEYHLGDRKRFNDLPFKVRREEWNKCFYWLLNQNKPMIIEGHFDYLLMDDERLQTQYPIVIKRTSMTTSIFRMLKRELSREHNESTPLVKWLLKHLQTYPNAKKDIDNAIGVIIKHYPEDYQELDEATYPDKEEYDLSKVKFTHIENPHYKGDEPYIYIEGKKLRVRGELIVFDKQGRIFVAERMHPRQDMTYAFPGGGIEPNESIIDAAIRETEEEALIVPKNVKYSGYHYRVLFDVPKGKDMQYEGVLAYVCVGEYDKKYSKYVRKQDRDDIAERGKWIYPEEIDLAPVHKLAIESYKKSSIQESCEGIYDEDETRYLIENKTKTIEEFYKCLCDNFQYGIVYDKDTACPKPSGRINFDKYRTLSVYEMLEYRIGVCWDYVELESYYFKKKFGYDNTVGKLQNKKFSVYYIQFEDEDKDNPTHTWLAYMNNGKVYSFEVSWYSERGIKEFDTEMDMIEHYWKIHKEHCSKQCKVYRGLVLKYKPFCYDFATGFNLDCEQFMDAVLKKGKVIKSEFKSYPVSLIVNESILPALTFYHGSPEKLDKIEPVSFSAGNKFRKPEWAVFMFKQKEMAEDFAFSRAVHIYLKKNMIDKFEGSIMGYMEKVGFATYKYHHYIRAKYYEELKNLVKGLKYYVYALEVPIDSGLNVIGTTWTLPEYTYTGTPKVVKREEFIIDDESFDSRYEPLSDKIFDRYNKNKIYKENVIGPWMYLLIDMEDRSKKRKIALKKMKSGELKPGDDLSFLDELKESKDVLAEMDTTFLDTEYD